MIFNFETSGIFTNSRHEFLHLKLFVHNDLLHTNSLASQIKNHSAKIKPHPTTDSIGQITWPSFKINSKSISSFPKLVELKIEIWVDTIQPENLQYLDEIQLVGNNCHGPEHQIVKQKYLGTGYFKIIHGSNSQGSLAVKLTDEKTKFSRTIDDSYIDIKITEE